MLSLFSCWSKETGDFTLTKIWETKKLRRFIFERKYTYFELLRNLKVTYYANSTFSCLLYINMSPLCVKRFWKFQEKRFAHFLSWSIYIKTCQILATLWCHNDFVACVTISLSPTKVTPPTLSPESPPRELIFFVTRSSPLKRSHNVPDKKWQQRPDPALGHLLWHLSNYVFISMFLYSTAMF